jgi:hypothetical protein
MCSAKWVSGRGPQHYSKLKLMLQRSRNPAVNGRQKAGFNVLSNSFSGAHLPLHPLVWRDLPFLNQFTRLAYDSACSWGPTLLHRHLSMHRKQFPISELPGRKSRTGPDNVSWPAAAGEFQIIKTQTACNLFGRPKFSPSSVISQDRLCVCLGVSSHPLSRDVYYAFCVFHSRFFGRLLVVDTPSAGSSRVSNVYSAGFDI